jgi:hypothetical protein
MTMKDDLRRARAAELRSNINKLRREAGEGQIAQEDRLLREILEAVGELQDEMKDVKERLDRLDPSGA